MSASTPQQEISAVDDTDANPSMQQTTEEAPIDFLEMLREEARRRKNKDVSEEEILRALVDHWDEIVEQNESDDEDVEQMREFILRKSGEYKVDAFKVRPSRKSVERWIEMLEGLLDACRAFLRVEQFLMGRFESRPESYSKAFLLFSVLKRLPKIPRPNWEDPSSKVKSIVGFVGPNVMSIQMQHSFVCTSQGMVMLPDEVARIIAREMSAVPQVRAKYGFTPTQAERLRRIHDEYKDYRDHYIAWRHHLQRIFRMASQGCTTLHPNKPAFSPDAVPAVPLSLMSILETYHTVSKLVEFYGPHPGPEFERAREFFLDLRRELQKDLTSTLRDMDFTKYLS